MRKAVIDTNIIVSALLSSNDEAATVKVLELLLNGHILPVVTASCRNMKKFSDGKIQFS